MSLQSQKSADTLKREKFTQLRMELKQHLLMEFECAKSRFGAVYLVTLKNVTPLNFPSQKSKRKLLKTSLVNSVKAISTKSTTCVSCSKILIFFGVLDNDYIALYVYEYLLVFEHG